MMLKAGRIVNQEPLFTDIVVINQNYTVTEKSNPQTILIINANSKQIK